MKIAIGSDHAGFQYKGKIREFLESRGHNVTDFGTHSEEPVDYPLFIRPVAEAVARGEFDRGIVLGGSGNGEAIIANRVKGIRCALCWNADPPAWAGSTTTPTSSRWASAWCPSKPPSSSSRFGWRLPSRAAATSTA